MRTTIANWRVNENLDGLFAVIELFINQHRQPLALAPLVKREMRSKESPPKSILARMARSSARFVFEKSACAAKSTTHHIPSNKCPELCATSIKPCPDILRHFHKTAAGRREFKTLADVILSDKWEYRKQIEGFQPPASWRSHLKEVLCAGVDLANHHIPGCDTNSFVAELVGRLIMGLSKKVFNLSVLGPYLDIDPTTTTTSSFAPTTDPTTTFYDPTTTSPLNATTFYDPTTTFFDTTSTFSDPTTTFFDTTFSAPATTFSDPTTTLAEGSSSSPTGQPLLRFVEALKALVDLEGPYDHGASLELGRLLARNVLFPLFRYGPKDAPLPVPKKCLPARAITCLLGYGSMKFGGGVGFNEVWKSFWKKERSARRPLLIECCDSSRGLCRGWIDDESVGKQFVLPDSAIRMINKFEDVPMEPRSIEDPLYYLRWIDDNYHFCNYDPRKTSKLFQFWAEREPVHFLDVLTKPPIEFSVLKDFSQVPPDMEPDYNNLINARTYFIKQGELSGDQAKRIRFLEKVWPMTTMRKLPDEAYIPRFEPVNSTHVGVLRNEWRSYMTHMSDKRAKIFLKASIDDLVRKIRNRLDDPDPISSDLIARSLIEVLWDSLDYLKFERIAMYDFKTYSRVLWTPLGVPGSVYTLTEAHCK